MSLHFPFPPFTFTFTFTSPGTTFDLFSSIAPNDVRFLITDRPDNLETLVRQAVGQLEQITRAPSVEHFGETITYVHPVVVLPVVVLL